MLSVVTWDGSGSAVVVVVISVYGARDGGEGESAVWQMC